MSTYFIIDVFFLNTLAAYILFSIKYYFIFNHYIIFLWIIRTYPTQENKFRSN